MRACFFLTTASIAMHRTLPPTSVAASARARLAQRTGGGFASIRSSGLEERYERRWRRELNRRHGKINWLKATALRIVDDPSRDRPVLKTTKRPGRIRIWWKGRRRRGSQKADTESLRESDVAWRINRDPYTYHPSQMLP